MIRYYCGFLILGFVAGVGFQQMDPQMAELIITKLIPFGVGLDSAYVLYQIYPFMWEECYRGMDPYFILMTHTQAQQVYAELLPILGSDFLGQFNDVSLVAFYSNCKAHNVAFSLDHLITGYPQYNLAQFILAILPFHFSNRKPEFFSSIKIKKVGF
jgi:hypothetical protein